MTDTTTTQGSGPTHQEDILIEVAARNLFYRDSYRKVLIALNLAIVALVILIVAVIYIVNHPPQPKYFATYADGKLVPMIPLDQPNVTDTALEAWVNTAIMAVNTYDFFNYRDQLQKASGYFTPQGWEAYMNSLQASRNLNALVVKKLVVSAIPKAVPAITRSGVLNGVYTWTVDIPITVTFQSGSETNSQDQVVTLTIQRVDTLTNPDGIGITNYISDVGSADLNGANITAAAQG